VGLEALFGAPVAADTPFTIVATQAELNAYLAGNTFQQQGLTLRDVQVTITAKEVSAHAQVSQPETGINAGMTVRGVPTAVNGAAYFKINDVTLDPSVGGLTRLMAKAAIDRAIKQYSSAYGVPIPTAGVDVREILLQPGQITISGRTRG
jgi:hypothetical protein